MQTYYLKVVRNESTFEGLTSSEEIVEKIKEEVIHLYDEKEEQHDSRTHA